MSPSIGEKKCVDGAEYEFISTTPTTAGPATGDISAKLDQIINLLTMLISGTGGICGPCNGEYIYIERFIDPNKSDEEIPLGISARHIHLMINKTVKIKLGSTSGNEIRVDVTESPFQVRDIGGPGINTIFFKTGVDSTLVRILAYN